MKINIIWRRSPNFFANTGPKNIMVIHKTLGNMPGTLSWLRNPVSQVSTHFLITKKGELYQLVKENDGAWHAGVEYKPSAKWKKLDIPGINNNRYTYGVEFEALINDTFNEKQYELGVWLANKLGVEYIITHKDINARKPNLDTELKELLRRRSNPPQEPISGEVEGILLGIIRYVLKLISVLKGRGVIK